MLTDPRPIRNTELDIQNVTVPLLAQPTYTHEDPCQRLVQHLAQESRRQGQPCPPLHLLIRL
jgi:hypothetical protein